MAADKPRDPAAEIAALVPGSVFHDVFEVVRCIKSGGMGAVYEVLQTTTQRRRALKVMLPSLVSDPEMRARFELEAKIAAGIESEHIVETMDAGIDQATGMPFIVMELLRGEELGALLKARKRLSPDDAVTYLHQAALALDRTHAAGIIHRDLKPDNLFLTLRDDGSPRIKILDFGVAKIVAEGSVNANSTKTVGSPMYMGPEQILGDHKMGPAVDRYSLAQIAFTLLVGRPYWHVERKAAEGIFPFMMKLVKGIIVAATARAEHYGVSLPEAFDPWFVKATATEPSQRFESSVAMIDELAQVFGVAAKVRTPSLLPRAPLPTAPSLDTLPSPVSSAPVSVKSSPAEIACSEPTPAPPSAAVEITPKEGVSVMVRSDEPSLQPVTVTKSSTRVWVVSVSLFLVSAVGAAGAFVAWSAKRAAANQATSVQIQLEMAQSPSPSTATIAAASAIVEVPSTAAPEPSTSSSSTVEEAKSASPVVSALPAPTMSALPQPSVTASTKRTRRKAKDVLDQY